MIFSGSTALDIPKVLLELHILQALTEKQPHQVANQKPAKSKSVLLVGLSQGLPQAMRSVKTYISVAEVPHHMV